MPIVRAADPSPSRLLAAAGIVGAAAGAYRFVVFNGFSNDHYMHLAWAQQVTRGAVPGRDFMEPGMPLTVALSALAQAVGGRGIAAELVLCLAMIAVTAGLTCWLAARFTGSLLLGVAAGVLQIAIHPRLYNYPKFLVPVVGVALLWHYLERPTARRAALAGAWLTVGFLFRHDYLVYLTLGGLAAFVLMASSHGFRRIALHAAVSGVTAAALVLPYLVLLTVYGGLQSHVRDAVEFVRGEDNQWTFPLPGFNLSPPDAPPATSDISGSAHVLSAGVGPALSRVATRTNATALLYYGVFLGPVFLLTGIAYRSARRRPRRVTEREAQATILVLITLSLALVVVRHPIESRLVDAGGTMPLVLAVALSAMAAQRATRALGGVVLGLAAGAVVIHGEVRPRLQDADAFKGPRPFAAKFRNIWSELQVPPWEDYWPAGDLPGTVPYLRECTGDADRVVVTWFAPEIFAFADRGFAAGHAIFIRRSFYAPAFQRRMIAWLERERAPVALINMEQEWFGERLPFLQRYLDTEYVIVGTDRFREDEIAVAIRRGATPTGVHAQTGWPCLTARPGAPDSPAHSRLPQ